MMKNIWRPLAYSIQIAFYPKSFPCSMYQVNLKRKKKITQTCQQLITGMARFPSMVRNGVPASIFPFFCCFGIDHLCGSEMLSKRLRLLCVSGQFLALHFSGNAGVLKDITTRGCSEHQTITLFEWEDFGREKSKVRNRTIGLIEPNTTGVLFFFLLPSFNSCTLLFFSLFSPLAFRVECKWESCFHRNSFLLVCVLEARAGEVVEKDLNKSYKCRGGQRFVWFRKLPLGKNVSRREIVYR